MSEIYTQLPLPLLWREDLSFENFYANSDFQGIVFYLKQFLKDPKEWLVYLWGPHGVGKSHLLQACCQVNGENSMYLSLAQAKSLQPEVLEGMENFSLLCLDDIHCVLGQPAWERQLFNLYNDMQALGNKLVLTANAAANELTIQLPDLRSRLMASVIFHLGTLNDDEKLSALQLRAEGRGIKLSDEVAAYLLNHCPRDMRVLFSILDKLDNLSIIAKRRLTIPFIKEILVS